MGKKLLRVHDVDFTGDEMQYKWYIVCTMYNNERKAAQQIEKRFFSMGAADKFKEIFVPIIEWEEETVTKTGKKRKVKKSRNLLEGGYIFIKMIMDNHTWNIVRQTTGVAGWLQMDGRPKEEDESEVLRIKKMMGLDKQEKEEMIKQFAGKVGDEVTITDGGMSGYKGKIIDLIKDRVKIAEVNTGMQIELGINQIELINS